MRFFDTFAPRVPPPAAAVVADFPSAEATPMLLQLPSGAGWPRFGSVRVVSNIPAVQAVQAVQAVRVRRFSGSGGSGRIF